MGWKTAASRLLAPPHLASSLAVIPRPTSRRKSKGLRWAVPLAFVGSAWWFAQGLGREHAPRDRLAGRLRRGRWRQSAKEGTAFPKRFQGTAGPPFQVLVQCRAQASLSAKILYWWGTKRPFSAPVKRVRLTWSRCQGLFSYREIVSGDRQPGSRRTQLRNIPCFTLGANRVLEENACVGWPRTLCAQNESGKEGYGASVVLVPLWKEAYCTSGQVREACKALLLGLAPGFGETAPQLTASNNSLTLTLSFESSFCAPCAASCALRGHYCSLLWPTRSVSQKMCRSSLHSAMSATAGPLTPKPRLRKWCRRRQVQALCRRLTPTYTGAAAADVQKMCRSSLRSTVSATAWRHRRQVQAKCRRLRLRSYQVGACTPTSTAAANTDDVDALL